MSSSRAFIASVKRVYDITLVDEKNFLSGRDGRSLMDDIGTALSAYSPGYIRKMVALYMEADDPDVEGFQIVLEPSDGELAAYYSYPAGIFDYLESKSNKDILIIFLFYWEKSDISVMFCMNIFQTIAALSSRLCTKLMRRGGGNNYFQKMEKKE